MSLFEIVGGRSISINSWENGGGGDTRKRNNLVIGLSNVLNYLNRTIIIPMVMLTDNAKFAQMLSINVCSI